MEIGFLQLDAHRKSVGAELSAWLFLSKEKGKLIIAPVLEVLGGVIQEQALPLLLPLDTSYEDLGRQVKTALLAFSRNTDPNFSFRNPHAEKLEWPAYKVSKMKSQKEFEGYFVKIGIRTRSHSLLIESHDTGIKHIFVGASLNLSTDDESLGEALFRVYRCAKQLARVDFVV